MMQADSGIACDDKTAPINDHDDTNDRAKWLRNAQHRKNKRQRKQDRKMRRVQQLIAQLRLPVIPLPPPLPWADQDADLSCVILEDDDETGNGNSSTSPTVQSMPSSIHGWYRPIPEMTSAESQALWSEVPAICQPEFSATAIHNRAMTNGRYLAMEEHRRTKLLKKWKKQHANGVLTEAAHKAKVEELEATRCLASDPFDARSAATSDDQGDGIGSATAKKETRKRQQVENIAQLLQDCQRRWLRRDAPSQMKMPTSYDATQGRTNVIVDFGSGSGNLTLPLAAKYPRWLFVLVDQKGPCLEMARHRIRESKLRNVVTMQYQLTLSKLHGDFLAQLRQVIDSAMATVTATVSAGGDGSGDHHRDHRRNRDANRLFNLGIGWHSCGSFTDMVLDICSSPSVRADCIVCPCCNGGLETTAYLRVQKNEQRASMDDDKGRDSQEIRGEAATQKTEKETIQQYTFPRSSWWNSAPPGGTSMQQLSASTSKAAPFWLQSSAKHGAGAVNEGGSSVDDNDEREKAGNSLSTSDYLTVLCKAADHNQLNSAAAVAASKTEMTKVEKEGNDGNGESKNTVCDAKAWMEMDRYLWAYEQEVFTRMHLLTLSPLSCSPKHHVLYLAHG